jgi:uncharacterized protein
MTPPGGLPSGGRLTYLTLPVDELAASCSFYEGVFGWSAARRIESAAFFSLPNLTVALMERTAFNDFINSDSAPAPAALASWNVGQQQEVDALLLRATNAGARIRRSAGRLSWGGRAGVFESPDGHLWEIVWNPRHTNPPAENNL